MSYIIQRATPQNIDEIMRLENESFAEGIRETKSVFSERLSVFPDGNFVLTNSEVNQTSQNNRLAGYLCSELWSEEAIPQLEQTERESLTHLFTLGHSARKQHNKEGTVLYISSFATDPSIRGMGRFLFTGSIERIREKNKQLTRIIFIVNEEWKAARHIYETEGFIYVLTLDNFFSSSAAFIMEKKL